MDPVDDVAMPFLLQSAFRNLVDSVHDALDAAGFPGVRATHGFAMQAIGTGCTSVELAERLGVSKQAATKTAQALETMGFIERAANPRDRRERLLRPTRRGRTMLRLSATAFRAELSAWRERVGDADVDTTLATLAQVGRGGRSHTDLSDWTPEGG
ncbi:MarR family protein [Nocardioides terrae]|uniref:MarR family protein n=1 Tax=Nocardioides terrae TaxID=574651 RepID=A0A1I1H6K2_9ACTN|nr:MarR family transcriptional regulator [Nocardioides terrae]SFC16780.1 MarR family protein [Nocardioides terrae]